MSTFKTVASGDYVPASTGLVLSIGALPGGNASSPTLMRGYAAHLGNFGTGSPVGKAQVQRVAGGSWYDIVGATITDNGTVNWVAYGVAMRWSVPTLTSPGTTTTAPRVIFHGEPLYLPQSSRATTIPVSQHYYAAAAGTTDTEGSLPGYGLIDPNVPAGGVPYRTLLALTVDGAGSAFVESTYTDSDGNFLVAESAAATGGQQVIVQSSFARENHINFTDSTGTTALWLDSFQVPI